MTVIEVKDFKNYYRETQAVDGINFSVERGKIFAITTSARLGRIPMRLFAI